MMLLHDTTQGDRYTRLMGMEDLEIAMGINTLIHLAVITQILSEDI